MTTAIIDKLFAAMRETKGMPARESNVAAILDVLDGAREGRSEVATRVVEDVALTQQVLRLANSPMYAPFADGAASVSGALKVLGGDALLYLVLSTVIVDDNELAEDYALSQALLAGELARNVCPSRLEGASVATMMFDLGRLVVEKYLPEENAAIRRKTIAGTDAEAAAAQVLGMTLQRIGVAIAERWRLPMEIVALIDGSGDPDLVGIARFSSSAASLLQEGRTEEAQRLAAELDVPGVDKTHLAGWIRQKAGTLRPRPPVAQASHSGAQATDPGAQASHPVAQATRPEDLLEELHAALTEDRKRSIDDLAGAMCLSLGTAAGMAHCLLFMRTRNNTFTIRHGSGKGIDSLKSRLRIPAEFKPTAFHAAIQNKVDVLIEEAKKLKPAALPENYGHLLPDVVQFLVLPISGTTRDSRVVGLMYCDWESSVELTPPLLAAIKKLRDLFAPLLPH